MSSERFSINMKEHYELEYIHFMINILNPYIDISRIKENDNDDGTIKMMMRRSETDKVELTNAHFVHFLQVSFPKIINDESSTIKSEMDTKHLEHDIFECYLRMDLDDFKKTYEKNDSDSFYLKLINMNEEELTKMKKYYGLDSSKSKSEDSKSTVGDVDYNKELEELGRRLTYLERLSDFNKKKHSTISNILELVDNFKYII